MTLTCENTLMSITTYMSSDKLYCQGNSSIYAVSKEMNPEYGACLRIKHNGKYSVVSSAGCFDTTSTMRK